MDSLIQNGLLGIVTGILTTVILFLAKVFWDAQLRPLLQEIRYAGVKIDGKWEGHGADPDGQWQTAMLLFLEQSALNLSGTFSLKHDGLDNQYELHFKVSGKIWEGYAILNFTPIDRRVTSYATTMLKIASGGANLIGQIAYRNVIQEMVVAEAVFLDRGP